MREWTIPNSPTGKSFEAFEPTPGCISVAVTPWSQAIVDLSKKPYTGAHIEIFRIMMQYLGWCYYLVAPADMSLGILVNGSYTGGVGMLARREVDMLMGPIVQHPTRSELVEYAQAYLYNTHYFLYKKITKVQPDVLIFTKPFLTDVWLWVLASVIAVGGTAGLLHLVHSYIRNSHLKSKQSKWVMFSRGLTWAWKTVLAQDPSDSPGERSGRLLSTLWLINCFMIINMYQCNITAILINDKVKLPFTSVEDFVTQKTYKLTWINGQIYSSFFQEYAVNQPDLPLGKLWGMRDDYQPDANHVVSTVMTEKVAVVAARWLQRGFMAGDFSEFGECRLALAEANSLPPVYMTYGYPKNSPLQVKVDIMLLRVVQSGIAGNLLSNSLWNSSWCMRPQTSLSDSRPLAVTDFLGLFAIYGLGMILALLVFIVEVATGRDFQSRKNE